MSDIGYRIGGYFITGAEGRTRTDTEVTLQQFLRLPRLPIPPLRPVLLLSYPLLCHNQRVLWCRGGELNSHELTLTTPSRWRVYRFHHLGSSWQNKRAHTPQLKSETQVFCTSYYSLVCLLKQSPIFSVTSGSTARKAIRHLDICEYGGYN